MSCDEREIKAAQWHHEVYTHTDLKLVVECLYRFMYINHVFYWDFSNDNFNCFLLMRTRKNFIHFEISLINISYYYTSPLW